MAKRPNLAAVDLKDTGTAKPERDTGGRKAQTMRLSEKALRGLKIRAAVFNTTQAELVERYVLEGFERHPLPSDLGL